MALHHRKKNYTYTYKDFFSLYRKRKRSQGFKPRELIEYKLYMKAIEHFMILLCRKILRESFVFILPYGLGNILLKSARRTLDNAPVNWGETKRIKKLVRHIYLHTFGYYFFTSWSKAHVAFKNKTLYKFSFVKSEHSKQKDSGHKILPEHILKVSKDPHARSILKY